MDEHDVGEIARGLTLAGFLDDGNTSRSLWGNKIDKLELDGWLSDIESKARSNFKHTCEAHHWFHEFLAADDEANAFAAMRLFERRVTLGSMLHCQKRLREVEDTLPLRRREHVDAASEKQKAILKKAEDSQKQNLFGTRIRCDVQPWL